MKKIYKLLWMMILCVMYAKVSILYGELIGGVQGEKSRSLLSTLNESKSLDISAIPTAISPTQKKVNTILPTLPKPPVVVSSSEQLTGQLTEKTVVPKFEFNDVPELALPNVKNSVDELELSQQYQETQSIMFQFENAALDNVLQYVEKVFAVKFITDDIFSPAIAGAGLVQGNKLTFKTNTPLTREDAWKLFTKFIDIVGLALIPTITKDLYRITSTVNANQEPLPTFLNTKIDELPDSSEKIRYLFFVINSPLATIQQIVSSFIGKTAKINTYTDLNAIIITDSAINIRSIMRIVQEFDKEIPEAMSFIQLQKADAVSVEKLYHDLTKVDGSRPAGQRKQSDSLYFPVNARVIAEPRTNALIVLGSRQSVSKIEEFIVKYIDVELDQPYSPLHVYELQYTNASSIASILSKVVTFGSGTDAARYGGVRDGMKFFKNVSITPESSGNRLIIKADDNDYLKIKETIQKLDVLQPQVAIEVLIVDVDTSDRQSLGMQIRKKDGNNFINNVDYQTSGLPQNGISSPIMTNNNNGSLITSLISAASGGLNEAGSVLLTFGNAASNGVWGVLKMLQSYAQTNILSNPFLITTNNNEATVTLGSTRRILSGSVQSGSGSVPTYGNAAANLTVDITPQISFNGMIQMHIKITVTEFTNSTDLTSGDTFTKSIETYAMVGDQEVLALGGFCKNKVIEVLNQTPILSSIPIVGWFFKNKAKVVHKTNLLIFISPHIITATNGKDINEYTDNKIKESRDVLDKMQIKSQKRDPVNRMFFSEQGDAVKDQIDTFINQNNKNKNIDLNITSTKNIIDIEQNNNKTLNKKNSNYRRRYGRRKGEQSL